MVLCFDGDAVTQDRVVVALTARLPDHFGFLIGHEMARTSWHLHVTLPLKVTYLILGPLIELKLLILEHARIKKFLKLLDRTVVLLTFLVSKLPYQLYLILVMDHFASLFLVVNLELVRLRSWRLLLLREVVMVFGVDAANLTFLGQTTICHVLDSLIDCICLPGMLVLLRLSLKVSPRAFRMRFSRYDTSAT